MPEMDNFFKRIWEEQEKARVRKQEWDEYLNKIVEEVTSCEDSKDTEPLIISC